MRYAYLIIIAIVLAGFRLYRNQGRFCCWNEFRLNMSEYAKAHVLLCLILAFSLQEQFPWPVKSDLVMKYSKWPRASSWLIR